MSRFTTKAIGSILGLLPILVLGTGPVCAGESQFLIGGFIGVAREGNFFQSATVLTAQNVVFPGLHFQFDHETPTLRLRTAYRPALVYPTDLTEFYSFAQNLDFSLTHDPTRRFQYRFEENAVVSPFVTLPGQAVGAPILAPTRSDHWSNYARFELRGYVTRRVAIVSDLRSQIHRYELPTLTDSDGLGATVGIQVDFNLHEIEFRMGYTGFGFASENSESGPSAWVTYRAIATPRNDFVAEVGMFTLKTSSEPDDPSREEFSSWLGRMEWNTHRPRFGTTLGFLRQASGGSGLEGTTVNMNLFASISFHPNPLLDYGFSGTVSDSQSTFESADPELEGDRFRGQFAALTARLDWGVTRIVGLYATLQHIWQQSNDQRFDDLNYPRAMVGLAFTMFETGRPSRSPLDWMRLR